MGNADEQEDEEQNTQDELDRQRCRSQGWESDGTAARTPNIQCFPGSRARESKCWVQCKGVSMLSIVSLFRLKLEEAPSHG